MEVFSCGADYKNILRKGENPFNGTYIDIAALPPIFGARHCTGAVDDLLPFSDWG